MILLTIFIGQFQQRHVYAYRVIMIANVNSIFVLGRLDTQYSTRVAIDRLLTQKTPTQQLSSVLQE